MKNYCDDERLISAFLNNYRMVDVMKETGLAKNTVYKIRNDPDFQTVLSERKSAILKAAIGKMQSYMLRDVDALQEIIENPETAPQTRVNAISIMLNQLASWISTVELVSRIEELENAIRD